MSGLDGRPGLDGKPGAVGPPGQRVRKHYCLFIFSVKFCLKHVCHVTVNMYVELFILLCFLLQGDPGKPGDPGRDVRIVFSCAAVLNTQSVCFLMSYQ